jgi:valyl-tRNA synthetase
MKLAKTYDPNQYEPNIYAMWEKSNAFASKGKGDPYCIVMPPPNANGNLHIGHALGGSVQDILTRYWRMRGKDSVYIPGADHAGFETWVVYERILTEKGINRFDFSREQLYSQVWDFVEQQRGNMELQLRALGTGCSWGDLVFTLDKKVIDTVYKTFKKMWDDGLIYRGERIVNYSTKYQTSYADIEVNHKMEKGMLWDIAYPTYDRIGEIVVSTTRPETMFGDTAIAVHPNDPRYKNLIGTRVLLPLTDREIPIIGDEAIDMTFGTGAVKVTPAHDPNDFEIGKRHDLPRIQVIDYDGTMINVPGKLAGMTVEEARKYTLALLRAEELIRGEKEIEHTVGYDYKSGLPIQPLIKDQWFIKVKPLADRARQAIIDGEITFTPESKKHNLIRYYEQLRDWNISRQIPWGIPIPAFQNIADPDDWIFDDRVDEEVLEIDGKTYRREEDTFDTWFSSAQWPFITTDYLDGGKLSKHYPIDVMETAADILPAWVSRMIMIGLYITDKVPFKHVYLHGLVLDEHGQKMSKSKGNVINPMDAISKYGSDALRMGLIASRTAGQNQAFSLDRVIAGRNFCNKLWNISRFIEDKIGDGFRDRAPEPKTMADHWIVRQLTTAVDDVAQQIETYRFAEASDTVYHAIWDDVADWYIEASKYHTNPAMLAWVLDTILKIAHPFAPFVTETIWQTLAWHEKLIVNAEWPEKIAFDDIAAGEFSRLKKLIIEIRYVLTELPGSTKYSLLYHKDTLIEDNAKLIQQMSRLKDVQPVESARGLRLAATGREAWLDIPAETLLEHQTNLETRLAETHQQIKILESRLANKTYVEKAPAKLVEETKTQLQQKQALVERLQTELEVIK